MNGFNAANSYAQLGVQTGVMSASPYRLITMLFDGAQVAIGAAILHIESGNLVDKGLAISKATNIINDGLLAALDYERGGEIAEQLGQLYEYMVRVLLKANLNNDVAALEEVSALLKTVASAWKDIGNQQADEY